MDQSLGKYLRTQPVALQSNGQHESLAIKNIRKCPSCNQSILILRQKTNSPGFFVTCNGFPACRNTYWLPPSVIDAKVTDNICTQVLNYRSFFLGSLLNIKNSI